MQAAHNGLMDKNWFKQRKDELSLTDTQIGLAISRDRSIANKIINGGVNIERQHVDGLAKVLQVSREEILLRAGFLEADVSPPEMEQPPAIPNVEVLSALLGALLRHAPKARWSDPDVRRLAEALEYGLALVGRNPATLTNLDAIGMAAQAAADRFLDPPEAT